MKVYIRSEQTADYARIADINALTFAANLDSPSENTYLPEVTLVDALRHGSNFDPQLSLVAEVSSQVVGHVLFYPFEVYISGESLRALSLAPIAVHPAFQGKGIGSSLIEAGHNIGLVKAYSFVFLLGHPSYYPRFGYQPHMFGEGWLEIYREHIPDEDIELEERLVHPEDIPSLARIWKTWFEDIDMALLPGNGLMDWVTHSAGIVSTIVTWKGELIGYLRYAHDIPNMPKLFLAKDQSAMKVMLTHLKKKGSQIEGNLIHLPLHPNSRAVKEWFDFPYNAHLKTWEAAMINVLDPACQTLLKYCQQVSAGERSPGLLIYPPSIEFA